MDFFSTRAIGNFVQDDLDDFHIRFIKPGNTSSIKAYMCGICGKHELDLFFGFSLARFR